MMIKSFGPLSGVFTAPARGGEASSLIVIMHGWGADANDLADLAYPMSLRFPGAAFFVPNAPEPCSMNPMGRQWFDLSDTTAGPVAAGTLIEQSVAAAIAELGLDMAAVALTGFSQGGMMSLHCGLRMTPRPAAVVSFSGALLSADGIAAEAGRPAVLLVHGSDDQVVPFGMMQAAATALTANDVSVRCIERPGLGHGIDPDALTGAIDFLAEHLLG
jgi:phospholipase/carboxylesterase